MSNRGTNHWKISCLLSQKLKNEKELKKLNKDKRSKNKKKSKVSKKAINKTPWYKERQKDEKGKINRGKKKIKS